MSIYTTSYTKYNKKVKEETKRNLLKNIFPPLPIGRKFAIVYADPPWHYNGKLQYDRSGNSKTNKGWSKDIFVSSAVFKYPTVKTDQLKQLEVSKIVESNSLLFMWTTNPHLAQAIELGEAWGFKYKTVAFVWNKMMHNPGQYTLSYCELCLLFKRGKIPTPRGARNIKQLINSPRTEHSVKPNIVAENIEKMFPQHARIELFARAHRQGWEAWGLETKREKISQKGINVLALNQNDLLVNKDL